MRFILRGPAVLFLLSALSFLNSAPVGAQTVPPLEKGIQAIITGPTDIAVGKTIILDASSSHVTGEKPEYRWTIEETKQVISRSVEAIYTPERPGKITIRLTVRSVGLDGTSLEDETMQSVSAYRRKLIVLADGGIPSEKLRTHAEEAMKSGVLLRIIQADPATPVGGVEDALLKLLTDQKDALTGAESIVVWTDGIAGLQALTRGIDSNADWKAGIRNQTIVLVTERSLATIGRTTRGTLTLLKPRELIITRNEAINPLLSAENIDEFITTIASRDIDALSLNASSFTVRPWNILSVLVNELLANGVSGQTILLLLMLPVIATIFAFLKQVVGITTFGLYTPTIVALSFMVLGWWIGLITLLYIIAMGYMTRSLMRRWSLLYIPKVAIILTVVSATLLLLVTLGAAWGLTFTRETIFILLILSTLAENFLQLKTEEGWWSALFGISETILGAFVCVAIVQWQFFQSLILAYPELLLLTIVVNVILGRWTGLRLVEYFRFREVFRHLAEE
ncbi:MAG: 7TM domain-containing protein [Candidatus Peribacteraceae bacterium]|nr:7TM domain-containing protein [Candidatus Peribacteraceae bacterium]